MITETTIHPADQLGRLQHGSYELPATERALAAKLIADREARVGREYIAIVHERATDNGGEECVDCVRLPDLYKVAWQLQQCVLVVDTETTGLYPARGDRLVSVAALGVSVGWSVECTGDEVDGHYVMDGPIGWELQETGRCYYRKVNPGRPSDPEAERIHGLTDLSAEPAFAEIAKEVHDFLDGETVVAHNAPFDLDFIGEELRRVGIMFPLYEDIIDTRVLSKMLWPDQSGSLDALAKRLGVDRGDRDARHDALDDCKILARCLPGLVREITKRLSEEVR
jgi:DNA polymerase III epsilon subunit family exonuclease